MAKVMLREKDGAMYFYVAKKDMEEIIKSVEFDSDDKWGGEILLTNDETWWVQPMKKEFPIEVVCKKISD